MTDVLARNSEQLSSYGADQYVGTTIKDSKGNDLTITSDGLAAAGLRQGAAYVSTYIRLQNGEKPDDFEGKVKEKAKWFNLDGKILMDKNKIQDAIDAIEMRLRQKRR